MMDANTRNFISTLLADNARLEQLAGLGFTIATCMQQLADGAGAGFGIPTLAPQMQLSMIQQIAHDLAARVNPPEPSVNGNGTRVLVGAGKEQPDA